MKKNKLLIILITILFLPFSINATVRNNYDITKENTNLYINDFSRNNIYIIKSTSSFNVPFIYNNGALSVDTYFKNGGLLNKYEFLVSKSKENDTYLFNGNNYWTLTSNGDKVYMIDNSATDNISLQEKTVLSGGRVTEYIREETGVSGSGTYVDPWIFTELYEITMNSSDKMKGTVLPQKYIAREGETVYFNVNPVDKYEYASNNCNLVYENGKLKIESVNKNMNCIVNFKKSAIEITYNNNGGSGCTSKKITSGEKIGSLCTPNKSSSQFDGWYKQDGTKVDENSVFTEPITLTAKWTPKFLVKYDYSNNGGNSSNATNQEVLNGNEANLSFTASKTGYTFLGWNTNVNATSPLKSFKPSANTTLYAIYRKTLTITYKDYQGIRTNSIHIYNKATSGDITLLSERKFQDNCGGSSWNNTYTNLGWSTGTTANGQITYSNGQTITISNDMTLNGQYKKEVRAVLDGNGGTCSPGYLASGYWIYYNAGSKSYSQKEVTMKVNLSGITCTRSGKKWKKLIECDKTELKVNTSVTSWTFTKGCAVYCEAIW